MFTVGVGYVVGVRWPIGITLPGCRECRIVSSHIPRGIKRLAVQHLELHQMQVDRVRIRADVDELPDLGRTHLRQLGDVLVADQYATVDRVAVAVPATPLGVVEQKLQGTARTYGLIQRQLPGDVRRRLRRVRGGRACPAPWPRPSVP